MDGNSVSLSRRDLIAAASPVAMTAQGPSYIPYIQPGS